MATTRIISMHINKGKTIAQCLKARVDYVKNPNKTEQGELISSYACAPETADQEFLLCRNAYIANTGRHIRSEVIAYQVRQSFKPGEVTPEEANKIGYELASQLLGGEFAFIVATHTDRRHIHNHLVFCAYSLDCTHKFRSRQVFFAQFPSQVTPKREDTHRSPEPESRGSSSSHRRLRRLDLDCRLCGGYTLTSDGRIRRFSDTPQSPIAGDVSPAARSAVKVGGSGVHRLVAFSLVTLQFVEMFHVQIRFRTPICC